MGEGLLRAHQQLRGGGRPPHPLLPRNGSRRKGGDPNLASLQSSTVKMCRGMYFDLYERTCCGLDSLPTHEGNALLSFCVGDNDLWRNDGLY